MMHFIFLSDIFGRTKAYEQLAKDIISKDDTFFLCDPYDEKPMNFKSEVEAYSYFIAHVGLEKYSQKVSALLAKITIPTTVIGFSVGASAFWMTSVHCNSDINGICFYSSQIRNQLHINPNCNVICYFPKQEAHFSVDAIMQKLDQKEKVICYKSEYFHGFMNQCSCHFNEEGYKKYLFIIKEALYN